MTTIDETNGVIHPKVPQWGTPIRIDSPTDVDGPTELAEGGGLKAGDETAPESRPVDQHLITVRPPRPERRLSEVPAWVTDPQVLREVLTRKVQRGRHLALAWTLHGPEMVLIALWWTIRGTVLVGCRVTKWLLDVDGHPLIGEITASNDRAYVTMARSRTQRQKFRWSLLAVLAVLALVVVAVTWHASPVVTVLLGLGVLALLVRSGKPEDVKILSPGVRDHVMPRLTAQNIVRAFDSLGIPALSKALKDDNTASLWRSAIVATKGGHKVWIQLPGSLRSADLIPHEQGLASALGRPEDTVIVEPMPHVTPGDLTLYVFDKPVLAGNIGPGPLATAKKTSWWDAPRLGVDRLGRPHSERLSDGSHFYGGRPNWGKSSVLTIYAAHTALDPRALLVIVNLKGSPDYEPLRPVCHRYLSANPDTNPTIIAETIDLLRWVLREGGRRNDYLNDLVRRGLVPKGTKEVTPEISDKFEALRPMTVILDEEHRLFDPGDNPDFKATGELISKAIKMVRSVAISIFNATQLAGTESIPGVIPRAARVRGCLSVTDSTSFRQIFGDAGPGAFGASGVAHFRPGMVLLAASDGGHPVKIRTHDLRHALPAIGERALALRTASRSLTGEAIGEVFGGVPKVDPTVLLGHVLDVIGQAAPVGDQAAAWTGGEDGLAAVLSARFPDVYGALTDRGLNDEFRRRGVTVESLGRRWVENNEPAQRTGAGVREGEVRRALAIMLSDESHER